MASEQCFLCRVKYPEGSLTTLPSGFNLCAICQGELPLREGIQLEDARYGTIEILAATEKKVWFQRISPHHREKPGSGIHHTSKRRAKRFLLEGPDWAEVPRWRLSERTLTLQNNA